MKRLARLLFAFGVCTLGLTAQAVKRIPASVTFVAGRTVYFDKGREAGIEPGDLVVMSPPGAGTIEAKIGAIAAQSCSAELASALATLGAGTPAEILVPLDRRAQGGAPVRTTSAPSRAGSGVDHPPWTRPLDPAAPSDLPLLAPAFGKARAGEPLRLRGRVWANLLETWDTGAGRDSSYFLGRVGLDTTLANVGAGGRIRLSGELTRRDVSLADAPDTSDSNGRVDRLSYRTGDGREDRWRFEIGRFLQDDVPELGLLDGIDVAYRTDGYGRFGVSLGALPAPYPDRAGSDDVQVALYHRLALGEHEEFVQVLALEKTWHKSKADRDLLLWNLESHPSGPFSFRTSTWLDLYTSSDTIKGSGLEVTQFQGQANCALGADTGVAALATYLRWPELLRSEFAGLPPDRIRNAYVERFGPSFWHRFDEHWRLDGRLDFWKDDRDSGVGGEVRASARDVFLARHELSVTLFRIAGSYLSGPGLRIWSFHNFESSSLRLGYELGLYETEQLTTGSESITQHALLGGYDWHFAERWDLSLSSDARFGDGAGSFSLGLYVQTRF